MKYKQCTHYIRKFTYFIHTQTGISSRKY